MKCLLDLDGVLVDFVGGMCRAHGRPNPYDGNANAGGYDMHAMWGISANEFWAPADAAFWHGLEMLPDGQRILSACVNRFGTNNVCLLTSPSLNEGAAEGKVRWIYDHLPAFKRQFLIGAAKLCLVKRNSPPLAAWLLAGFAFACFSTDSALKRKLGGLKRRLKHALHLRPQLRGSC